MQLLIFKQQNIIRRFNIKMEENIPYRKLRSIKAPSIHQTSQTLLRPIYRNRLSVQSKSVHKSKSDIMKQNVTQYQYMLTDPHLKQHYIKWATNLRSYHKIQPNDSNKQNEVFNVVQAPSVAYKKTQLFQARSKQKQNNKSFNINTADFIQYFGKQNTNLPQNDIKFLSQLRKIQLSSENKSKLLKHDYIFKNYGKKQKNILPRLLKKTAMKKMKDIKDSDYEIQMDGTHKYPEYTYKNLREKNSALLGALTKSHESVQLPCLAWSVGLRSY